MFEAERPSLVPYAGPFDGFHATPVSPSKTCLVRFDNNKYSVIASAVGRPVEVRAYADRIEMRQDGRIVGQHSRVFGRGQTVYDPWHYVPVLARKPGALRNGAPFQDWALPGALEWVRRKLKAAPDGDRQMVEVLGADGPGGLARHDADDGRDPEDEARERGVGQILGPGRPAVWTLFGLPAYAAWSTWPRHGPACRGAVRLPLGCQTAGAPGSCRRAAGASCT